MREFQSITEKVGTIGAMLEIGNGIYSVNYYSVFRKIENHQANARPTSIPRLIERNEKRRERTRPLIPYS